MTSSQDVVEIVIDQKRFIQSELFVEVLIILQKNVSKGSDRKSKKLPRLVLQTIDKRNIRLGNALDADMKIN